MVSSSTHKFQIRGQIWSQECLEATGASGLVTSFSSSISDRWKFFEILFLTINQFIQKSSIISEKILWTLPKIEYFTPCQPQVPQLYCSPSTLIVQLSGWRAYVCRRRAPVISQGRAGGEWGATWEPSLRNWPTKWVFGPDRGEELEVEVGWAQWQWIVIHNSYHHLDVFEPPNLFWSICFQFSEMFLETGDRAARTRGRHYLPSHTIWYKLLQ